MLIIKIYNYIQYKKKEKQENTKIKQKVLQRKNTIDDVLTEEEIMEILNQE
jgi:hypothetical protein